MKEKVEILKTTINSSILYELGGMYTMVSQTLREFVQNSFDSHANNVDINIDIINDVITITDDGIGMNDYIVRNHYKDVGFSSKNIDDNINDKMPTVPSELIYNLKRPKIGSKGMGKLSWILLADVMETITTTIDMDKAIKIEFSADDLENNKLSYINKNDLFKNGHGTILRLRGLKIKDFGGYSTTSNKDSFNEIEELTNTIGFLGVAFSNFRVYLSINSHTNKFARQLIIKKLYFKGIQIKKSGIFNYVTEIENKKVPYDFLLTILDYESKNNLKSESEFWLLSQYMGVKKLNLITGLSGYLNIDNIKLVANRNDIQSSENDLYRKLKDEVCDLITAQLATIYNSRERESEEKKSEENISILDLNQNDLLKFIYNFSITYRQLKTIIPYLKFKFYIEGEHRLKDFESDEKTIYYYFGDNDNNIVIADKASYCGYKCFEVMNESILVNTLTYAYPINDYIQNIEKLPKEAYEATGSSVSPIGGLKDVLSNLGPIFDSLAFALLKIENNIAKMKNELKTKKFSAVQRKERLKEITKLEKSLLSLKTNKGGISHANTVGTTTIYNVLNESRDSSSGNNNVKKGTKDALKLSGDHYLKYNILDREYLIGFASLEDENTIASIVMNKYITFNLKNDYIKNALTEKNPIRQVIMLLPLICHEICHEWSSTHDETFQMIFNALLIPSLDCLTKQIFEGDLKVKKVEEISINDKGEKKIKGFYDDKSRCSICNILLAKPESIKIGICGDCSKKMKGPR